MGSILPPTRTRDLEIFSAEKYRNLLEEGYLETSSQDVISRGMKGRYVKLEHPVSMCSRTARMAGCILSTPFVGLLSALTCFQKDSTWNPCIDHCFGPAMDGALIETGFVEDHDGTLEVRKIDFQAFGFETSNKKAWAGLVESGKFPLIQSKKFPQHFYMPFYGPKSQLSYIIVVPFGSTNDSLLYVVANKDNQPCNSQEMDVKGEMLCGGYKLGVKKIKAVSEKQLIAQADYQGTYGTVTKKVYVPSDRLIST